MMNFDPNNQKSPVMPKWASYIPGRRPEFKIHKQKGHATNALTNHSTGGIVYEFVDGQWIERYRVDEWKCAVEGCKPRYSNMWLTSSLYTLDGSPKYCSPVYCHEHVKEYRMREFVLKQ